MLLRIVNSALDVNSAFLNDKFSLVYIRAAFISSRTERSNTS